MGNGIQRGDRRRSESPGGQFEADSARGGGTNGVDKLPTGETTSNIP